MIASVRGVVDWVGPHSAIIDVHGVGLRVHIPTRTSASLRVGEDAHLHTSLIVREDDLSLYGFILSEERDTFDLLCGVNGVGPKSALGVLSALNVDDIAAAVLSDNDEVFRAVSGIGPKTAKLITLSLQGKISPSESFPGSSRAVESPVSDADHNAIVQALVGLGWSERIAKKGVDDVLGSLASGDDHSVPALVRKALLVLAPPTTREDRR